MATKGWETWNRTKIHGFKGRCPTVRRSPNETLEVYQFFTVFQLHIPREEIFFDLSSFYAHPAQHFVESGHHRMRS